MTPPTVRHGHGGPAPPNRAAVSFDIVGYTSVNRHEAMLAQVLTILQLVTKVLSAHPPDSVLWAPGGDGGHVLFLNDGWRSSVLDLLRDLRGWSERERVPLRIAVHYGPLEIILGADDRPQPVGDAINTAAWILTRGSSAGIVVSSQLRAAMGSVPGAEFHDRRLLRSKHGQRQQALYLLSRAGDRRSGWSDSVAADQQRLREAVERRNGLEAVYWAKRLMLVNGMDHAVTSALAALRPGHFRSRVGAGEETVNPIFGHLGPGNLRRLIALGQLIEFRYNDVLCRRGDSGSTMFVILRGQIGVYSPDERPGKHRAVRRATHSEGDIVGELAFALNRRRTADLVSLGDTAVLSFEFEELSNLLNGEGGMIWEFMTGRALEHVSQNVPYLIGRPLATLPKDERRRWTEQLQVLEPSCHIITREPHKRISLDDIRGRDARTAAGGIYILASGHLQSLPTEGKELDGEGFPLLYVDLPDLVVAPDHEYVVSGGPARIIFIGQEGINQLPPAEHERLIRGIKRELQSLYHYDAFISYNFLDQPTAERWDRALTDMNLKVFRDSPVRVGEPYPERDARALLDSLTVLVLVSPQAMVKDSNQNWMLKEVRFREHHFEKPRIIPVRLPQGDPQRVDIMYSAIQADGREPAAIEEAVSLIRAIRNGTEETPYGLHRHSGTRIV